MSAIRIGAVDYLNARPLVHGLDRDSRFDVRYDMPSRCATLLHEGAIDVGMIPSIEYLRGGDYRIVPGIGVISDGPVASVALFSRKPIDRIRTIAADTSSRTSNGLLRVLCRERFDLDVAFEPMPPDPLAMLERHDAALVIGDPALFFDHEPAGVLKIDLGEQWTSMTGLPFVWAFWAGRAGALDGAGVAALVAARDGGVAASDEVATRHSAPDRAALARRYLRENIKYELGAREEAGLLKYFELAAKHQVVEATRPLTWYPRRPDLKVGATSVIGRIADKVRAGGRLDRPEALELYTNAPTALLGRLADEVRARLHPDRVVTYIIDRNVNYTNVCVARCNFCAFYRQVGSPEGYVLGFEEIFRKIDETIALGGGQLLLQGGHNPDLPIDWYEDLFRSVKERYPTFRLHALSPPEIVHISRLSRLPVPSVIGRLVTAGLDSIPGGGAEILVDRVRKILNCYGKATSDEWLDVMRHAHRAGLRTTATMMYGTVETLEERLEHLIRLRDLQDEMGGFTAFITWSYQPEHTERGGSEATGVDYVRTLAIARLVLDNFHNLQASWVTQGGKVGQLSLAFGANDMGSVMIEENVVRAAGASYCMDEIEIVRNIENAGFIARRRNMHYETLGDPIFRERAVPRMLELAVARADGDTSRPPEIANYAARSAAEKKARLTGR
jgi:cyclic dehypoxanthinyl futalosine synthase